MASNLPQQNAINQYIGDGATVDFNFNFIIMENADLAVYVTAPNTTANPLVDFVSPSDYTITYLDISGMPPGAGFITFNVAPATNAIVTLARNMQISISTNFAAAQDFNGANLDTAFQRVGLMLQQLQGYFFANFQNGSLSRMFQLAIDTYLPTNAPVLLPNLTVNSQNQLTNNQVWVSLNGGIVAAPLFTGGDINTLIALLASQAPGGADGAGLIGFYDAINNVPQTLDNYLNVSLPALTQRSYLIAADDTGVADALVITLNPPLTAYSEYNRFYVKAANTNTTACTIDVNGLGAKAITHMDGSPILTGEIVAGFILELVYDGTQFQWLNPINRVATAAETLTGTTAVLPMTPGGFTQGGYPNKGTNASGYVKLPGGLIMQWGTVTCSNGVPAPFTFPIAFPTGLLTYSVTPFEAGFGGTLNFVVLAQSTSGLSLEVTANATNVIMQVLAIGY
jgi:hypothetical protein